MDFLYFTRSNGDVDSMENNPDLIDLYSRREFIGDQGAGNFVVMSNRNIIYPVFNGTTYVSNSTTKNQKIANIKNKRDTARSYITVSYDSKEWSFSRENMIDFGMKIARGRDFIWVADDRSQVNLTISKAEDIAKKVDDLLTKIFFDAETEIGNL